MPAWVPAHLLGWVSVTLMHLGLIGLYLRQAQQTGRLGLVSFVLAFLGGLFAGTIQYLNSTVIPLIAAQAPSLFDQASTPPPFAPPLFVLGFVLGHILFGLVTARAGVLPRGAGLLVMVGMTVFFIGEIPFFASRLAGGPALQGVIETLLRLRPLIVAGDLAFGLGFAWMGYALWRAKS